MTLPPEEYDWRSRERSREAQRDALWLVLIIVTVALVLICARIAGASVDLREAHATAAVRAGQPGCRSWQFSETSDSVFYQVECQKPVTGRLAVTLEPRRAVRDTLGIGVR